MIIYFRVSSITGNLLPWLNWKLEPLEKCLKKIMKHKSTLSKEILCCSISANSNYEASVSVWAYFYNNIDLPPFEIYTISGLACFALFKEVCAP